MTRTYNINYKQIEFRSANITVEGNSEEECIQAAEHFDGEIDDSESYDCEDFSAEEDVFPKYYKKFKNLLSQEHVEDIFELHRNLKTLFSEVERDIFNYKPAEIDE
jgi:hypothetical protein